MAASAPKTSTEKEQIFVMAEKEMEYRVELFNKLTQTCFNKCIEKRYKEAELYIGENSCMCVSKYWQQMDIASAPQSIIRGTDDMDIDTQVLGKGVKLDRATSWFQSAANIDGLRLYTWFLLAASSIAYSCYSALSNEI